MSRVPARYVPATWRDITPIDNEEIGAGIGFDTADGGVFLRLSVSELITVRGVIDDYLDLFQATNLQSSRLSGNSSSEVLTPDEVEK